MSPSRLTAIILCLTAVPATAVFGQHPLTMKGHNRDLTVVACSPDGKFFASGGADEKTVLWNPAASQSYAEVPAGGTVVSLAVSQDGRRVAAGENYHKVRLFDAATGAEVRTLEGHSSSVIGVGFTGDSRRLMTFSNDGNLRFWDAVTGAPQGEVQTQRDLYWSAAFSIDGKWLAAGTSGGNLYLYNVAAKKPGLKIQPGNSVKAVAFSLDGGAIVAAIGDSTVRQYSTADGKPGPLAKEVDANGVAFSPDGTRVGAAGHDNIVYILDAASMQVLAGLRGHDRTVRSVCFLPGALVSGSFDNTVRIWPLN